MTERAGTVVVDAANVVGSVPDGWWRDRVGATERLRDRLAVLASTGLPGGAAVPAWAEEPRVPIMLVVEGRARGVTTVDGVRVVAAAGSGDDAIVETVAGIRAGGEPCLVVTADRGLRDRVLALGATVTGPSAVRPRHGPAPH